MLRPSERGEGWPRSQEATLDTIHRYPRQRIAFVIIPGLVDRLHGRAARIPRRGRRRVRWLDALERAIADDARASVEQMAAENWGRTDALDAYGEWIGELIAAAVAEASREAARPA
jgi:hypothetical protein